MASVTMASLMKLDKEKALEIFHGFKNEHYCRAIALLVPLLVLVLCFRPYVSLLYFIFMITSAFTITRRLAEGSSYEGHLKEKLLEGRTVVITGASNGIGQQTAFKLGLVGADKIIIGVRGGTQRACDAAQTVRKEIKDAAGLDGNVVGFDLDLQSFKSVANFARKVEEELGDKPLDILVCNAGILGASGAEDVKITADGFEECFQVNALSHFYLTKLLLPKILKSSYKRIVNLSSVAYWRADGINYESLQKADPENFAVMKSYSQSKLAIIYLTSELHRRYEAEGLRVFTVHPGLVQTKMAKRLGGDGPVARWVTKGLLAVVSKNAEQGCQTTLYCCLDDAAQPGRLHSECKTMCTSKLARDSDKAKECWTKLEALLPKESPAKETPTKESPAKETRGPASEE